MRERERERERERQITSLVLAKHSAACWSVNPCSLVPSTSNSLSPDTHTHTHTHTHTIVVTQSELKEDECSSVHHTCNSRENTYLSGYVRLVQPLLQLPDSWCISLHNWDLYSLLPVYPHIKIQFIQQFVLVLKSDWLRTVRYWYRYRNALSQFCITPLVLAGSMFFLSIIIHWANRRVR